MIRVFGKILPIILVAVAICCVTLLAQGSNPASLQRRDDEAQAASYRYPTWSFDGSYIVCEVSLRYQEPQIYRVDRAGTNKRALTSEGGHQPTCSPDGTKLAFWRESGEQRLLCVLSMQAKEPATSVQTLVALKKPAGLFPDLAPAWSPSGDEIAFVTTDGISFYDIKEASVRRTGVRGEKPAWSPDGKHLAYIQDGSIWVMNAAGATATEIIRQSDLPSLPFASTRRIQSVSWSRKNRLIFDDKFHMYVAAPDGSDVRDLRFPAERMLTFPSWSPDGKEIVCCDPHDLGQVGLFVYKRRWKLLTFSLVSD